MKKHDWNTTSIWIWADTHKTGFVEIANDVSLDYDDSVPFRHGNQMTLDYSQDKRKAYENAIKVIQGKISFAEKIILEQNILLDRLKLQIDQNL